jgi:hypothetical protein
MDEIEIGLSVCEACGDTREVLAFPSQASHRIQCFRCESLDCFVLLYGWCVVILEEL